MPSSAASRLDYLDAVRAFALILGIVFHASLSFVPIFIGWAVMDVTTSEAVLPFITVSHSFRMELFFLIAGFFSHMVFHQKGAQAFVKSRFIRIVIPFVIGWIILRPLVVSGWVMGAESMQGDVNILAGIVVGFASLAELPKDLLVGTHLWFLYYLVIISATVLVIRSIIGINDSISQRLLKLSDSVISWCSRSSLAILLLAVPTAVCMWYMSRWGVDTPDKSLVPMLPVFVLYTGFFTFGWLLHRDSEWMDKFANLSKVKVCLGVVSVVATMVLSGYESQYNHSNYTQFKGAFAFSYAVMMWSLVILTLGLFKRFTNGSNKVTRYIADSSYWLYLVHLPLVIWLQIAFAEIGLPWLAKLVLIVVITLALAILMYDLFVRSTIIGQVLNGKKQARCIFTRKGALHSVQES